MMSRELNIKAPKLSFSLPIGGWGAAALLLTMHFISVPKSEETLRCVTVKHSNLN